MCVVSMVGDHYREKWQQDYLYPVTIQQPSQWPVIFQGVPQDDFDKLKAEVEEMKKLLIRAKEYDEKNGEPACEIEEKVALLRKVAQLVGVSLDDVLGAA